jgi:hypothetical protein
MVIPFSLSLIDLYDIMLERHIKRYCPGYLGKSFCILEKRSSKGLASSSVDTLVTLM